MRLLLDQPALQLGTQLIITGPGGGAVQQGQPRLVNNQVRQDITLGGPAGHYIVKWPATSADGHPVSGTFSFTANQPAASPAPSSTVGQPSARTHSGTAATPTDRSTGSAQATTGKSNPLSASALIWGGGPGDRPGRRGLAGQKVDQALTTPARRDRVRPWPAWCPRHPLSDEGAGHFGSLHVPVCGSQPHRMWLRQRVSLPLVSGFAGAFAVGVTHVTPVDNVCRPWRLRTLVMTTLQEQRLAEHVARLAVDHPPIGIASVDFTVQRPSLVRERFGGVLDYMVRAELEVERNVLELNVLLPDPPEIDKVFESPRVSWRLD